MARSPTPPLAAAVSFVDWTLWANRPGDAATRAELGIPAGP
ncbi:MAG TPA: hypothetical protein VH986_03960 [Acidimicrobiia bacterium]